ncbi:hypothetical protein [Persephonella sp.]
MRYLTILLFVSMIFLSCSKKEERLTGEDKCKFIYKVYTDCYYGSFFIEDPSDCTGLSNGFYKVLKKEGYSTDILEKAKSVCYTGCSRSINKNKVETYEDFKKKHCFF